MAHMLKDDRTADHVPVRVGIVWKFYTSYGKKDGGTTVEKNYFANAPPAARTKKFLPPPF